MQIEYIYEEVNASEIKENDYIESFNIKEQKYNAQRVNEIIKSDIPKDKQIKFITDVNELTVSISSKVYTDSGYKIAKDITVDDKLLVENKWCNIRIETDNKPSNFIDYNIANNSNFVVSNETGKKTLIHNSGSLAVYFSWWHLDVDDMLSLKSNGGTDENRARGLQYGIKLNRIFINKIIANEDIYLFDPKDTPKMIGCYGEEFEKAYSEYINKSSIRKKKIKARDLWAKVMKERSETGNIYLFHEENVNENTQLNRYIGSSNLCLSGDTLVQTRDGEKELQNIEIGDLVKSYNTKTRKNEYKEVSDFAMTNPKTKVMKITDEEIGKTITCTPEHKIWTENRGYVQAKDLKVDDILAISEEMSEVRLFLTKTNKEKIKNIPGSFTKSINTIINEY